MAAVLRHALLASLLLFPTSSHGNSFSTYSVQTLPVATIPISIPGSTSSPYFEIIQEVISFVEEINPGVSDDSNPPPTNVENENTSGSGDLSPIPGAGSSFNAPSYTTPVISNAPSSTATLAPVSNPNIDPQDYSHITPTKQVQYYYAGSASNSGHNAVIDFGFAYPVVPLEHISYITSISCSSTQIVLIISDAQAFRLAQSWPTSDFVLAGVTENGCGTTENTRFWALVSSRDFDSDKLSITAIYTYLTVKEVSTDFTINWNNNVPSGGSTVTRTITNLDVVTTTLSGSVVISTVTSTEIITSIIGTTATISSALASNSGSKAAATSSGLPSASISTSDDQVDFDLNLDNALGYLDSTSAGFLDQILPGINVPSHSRRDFLSDLTSAFTAVIAPFKSAVQAVTSVVSTVVTDVVSEAQSIIGAVGGFITETHTENLGPQTFNVDITPAFLKKQETLFGEGYVIYNGSDFGIYCVDCEFQADLTIGATVTWDLTAGITAAMVTVSGPMNLNFDVALIAEYEINKQFSDIFASIPLTPLTIFDIATLGPTFNIGAGVDIGFSIEGGILAGIDVVWNGIDADINLVNPGSSSYSGFQPDSIDKTLKLGAEITITGGVFATIGLDIGLSLLDGQFNLAGGIVDEPGLQVTVTIEEIVDVKRDIPETGTDLLIRNDAGTDTGCQGADIVLLFQNILAANLLLGETTKTWGLNTYTSTITETCYSFGPPTTTTSGPISTSHMSTFKTSFIPTSTTSSSTTSSKTSSSKTSSSKTSSTTPSSTTSSKTSSSTSSSKTSSSTTSSKSSSKSSSSTSSSSSTTSSTTSLSTTSSSTSTSSSSAPSATYCPPNYPGGGTFEISFETQGVNLQVDIECSSIMVGNSVQTTNGGSFEDCVFSCSKYGTSCIATSWTDVDDEGTCELFTTLGTTEYSPVGSVTLITGE